MTASATEKRPRTGKARKFFLVRMDFRIRTTPGWRVTNLETLRAGYFTLSPPPDRRGFAEFPEPPSLLIDDSLGRPPVDWEEYEDFMLVSGRMKRILDQIDLVDLPSSNARPRVRTVTRDLNIGFAMWFVFSMRWTKKSRG